MIQCIRGFRDILPEQIEVWQRIESIAIELLKAFGYCEIRIPIMEKAELFTRGIGENTDIVEKEMYTFTDRKGDLLTLRPEATASVARAYIQHKMYTADPVRKFYLIGPMFRRERPQKGRYRQFYQINVEAFGIASPYVDVQMIHLLHMLFHRLGVSETRAHVNSLGCPQCRPGYRATLTRMLHQVKDQLCEDCQRRMTHNPLRVLDCKVLSCRKAVVDAPELIEHLCDACQEHFNTVTGFLKKLNVPFFIDKRLVRGLDYYTRTTFEMQTTLLGAQSAVAGGGRYDGLVEALGGPPTPATGFAIGFDRLAEMVSQIKGAIQSRPDIFIAALGVAAQEKAFEWLSALGAMGLHTEMDYAGRSLKAQMKRADRLGAAWVLIVGDTELNNSKAALRNMATKAQCNIGLNDAVNNILKQVKID